MNIVRSLIATSCLAITCCAPSPEPVPARPVAAAPAPTPIPVPIPAPVSQPVYDNWMDAPATPGDWTYRADSTGTLAFFGRPGAGPTFTMRCEPSRGIISLLRAGRASGEVPMRILTELSESMVQARQASDQSPTLQANLRASDPVLEAMAFSKGRFAIETAGLPTLYIPAWPEVTRVIEDCRP